MSKSAHGFTLIELLVAISIIAILAIVGLVSFQGVRGKALEAKRKADVDSIKKAYEANYDPSLSNGQGGYRPLVAADFTNNKIPAPEGGVATSYFVVGPNSAQTPVNAPNFAICASKSGNTDCLQNPGNSDCLCATSTQGTPISLAPGATPTTIADDNQLSTFWNQGDENANYQGSTGPAKWQINPSDDSSQTKSGINSLKIAISPGPYRNIGVWKDDYSPRADWSIYKWLSFWWHGANTNALIRFYIQTDVGGQQPWFNHLYCSFNDSFTGWRQMTFLLNKCAKDGNPDLSKVWRLFIATQSSDIPSSAPASFNWWVDQLQLSP